MRIYFDIFVSFFKIGLFTFGGGYAMIPLIEREVVNKKKWINEDEFTEMLAIAQTAPGPMAVNTALFAGHKLKGWRGSLVAALGSILPSFIIILLIAMFFSEEIKTNQTIERIFKGMRPVVVALIAIPACNMVKKNGLQVKPITITLVSVLMIWLLNISPIIVIILAGLTGLVSELYNRKKQKQ